MWEAFFPVIALVGYTLFIRNHHLLSYTDVTEERKSKKERKKEKRKKKEKKNS